MRMPGGKADPAGGGAGHVIEQVYGASNDFYKSGGVGGCMFRSPIGKFSIKFFSLVALLYDCKGFT